MERSFISELTEKENNKKVLIKGWVSEIRSLGKVQFIVLRDKTDSIQCVVHKDEIKSDLFNKIPKISIESVLEIEGKLKTSKQAKKGFEITIEDLNILSESLTPLPIDTSEKSKTMIDKRLDYRFLDLRRPQINAIFKTRSKVFNIVSNFFDSKGFYSINTPKITAAGVESGAEQFSIDYFGKEAFLTQSPQVYKQMFVVAGLERVYEIGEVFRAEKSHTTRHLTEFTGIDLEMGFIKDENDVMNVLEELMKYLLKEVKEKCKNELELLNVKIDVPKKIPRITLEEAKKLVEKKGKKVKENEDLDAEGEKLISEIIKEKYDSDFVFITLYPWEKKPFYHMRDPKNKKVTKSFDLVYKGVEISSGSQREHNYNVLKEQSKEKGIDIDKMSFYADIFKYGAPPHGGAGIGFDRLIQRMLNLENVREAILLPRDPERLTP
ncbi:aspartate--tRNA(Asn) ligase [Candidatus Woesearchaeota archaeon]|nr:aspartate--tRNA(Asn) ligase [Candidatus Woesearchaeota archaeon]